MYQPRTYREWYQDTDLVGFTAAVAETDLYVKASRNLQSVAEAAILRYRSALELYIADHPGFLTSLEPVSVAPGAPELVREMADAAQAVGVGPMAAVAGAIAERVGRELMELSPEVIVENGGDIFVSALGDRLVGVYAGDSPYTSNIALEISGNSMPLGVCTSSGTVGHSLSLGHADAVIVLSPCTALADAAATAIGNLIQDADDIPEGVEFGRVIPGLKGLLVVKGDRMGLWGEVRICNLREDRPAVAGDNGCREAGAAN
ncbi:MAG: UPF0280 family protein [Chloroflexota bacterium]